MKSVSSGFIVGLTEFEINYLDYYTNHVANTVSILPKESNYFLSFYIPLAAQDKSVLYALFAWTDLFLSGNKSEGLHNRYLNKSIELLETKIESGCISSTDRLSSISVLTILCAAEICAGDVKDWYKYFRKLHKLIIDQSCGDIPGFLQRFFGNSNEAKWLMSNFLYHDVLSSLSYENGTFFKMEEYCQVLDIEWKRDPQTGGEISKIMDTGVVSDPLQGCVRPLYLLIGQITNSFVELERLAENIKMQEINDSDYTKLTNQKFDYYSTINDTFSELDFQINNSSPHTPALYYLNTDKELELHLTLFEAYRLSISIYLRNLIRKVPPASPEIQLLFIELVKCLDIVMGSNVQASLCFPLLLAGVSAVFSNDRNMIEQKLKTMCEEFPVKNFKRVLTIIKKTWQLNEEGRKCIYWFDITKELGWDLCLA
ncbi:hypothetical protein CANARDRAFT_193026 [[Candida] arabinofermentans NRRL YB-2248]|uniref:Uncharacterized protein n=1 Tax=[Candida] arabinofermentans NRRL YB-2248 TaxID=983967 RepID=A0A1E4T8M5_9ASCO|nr:hypothetical protein CANARDRAFT_193026 [[Candida] arabinofermentans NRRL YB-2248]